MLVDSKKVKQLRLAKNWTQQHLADVCGLSLRTIQRVEKDGVASNETVGSYAAIFEINAGDIQLIPESYSRVGIPGSAFKGAMFFASLAVSFSTGLLVAVFFLS